RAISSRDGRSRLPVYLDIIRSPVSAAGMSDRLMAMLPPAVIDRTPGDVVTASECQAAISASRRGRGAGSGLDVRCKEPLEARDVAMPGGRGERVEKTS